MNKRITKGQIALSIISGVLVIDQCIKILVKTHMFLHSHIRVTDWFYIFFTENIGMAFGMEIIGKLFLSLFRIVAVAAIGWMLYRLVERKAKTGFIACASLVLAGALGNIIDSLFYGLLFSESTHSELAAFLPASGTYAPLFYGKVVDMFYFPIIDSYWPSWMPFVGGEHFIFFSPIFNFADASISCGMIAFVLFYSKYWNEAYHLATRKKHESKEKTGSVD